MLAYVRKGSDSMYNIFSMSSAGNSNNWFQSMLGSKSSKQSGTSSFLTSTMLTDRTMIQSGTYKKLMQAYYDKTGTTYSSENQPEKDALSKTKGNAKTLQTAADVLRTTGKDSLFVKKTVADEESGNTTSEYDVESIYGAVKNYVSSYNDVIDETIESDNIPVLRKTLNMVNTTKVNERLLNQIGISIESDNTLKIDEETFKKADMTNVKSVFNGTNSLADRIGSQATDLSKLANNALVSLDNRTYTANGSYTSAASMIGSMYDTIL